MEAAAGGLELLGASLPANTTGPAMIRGLLDRAAANGFTVVRAWVSPVTAQYALQASGPGQARVGLGCFSGRRCCWRQCRRRG